MEVSIWTSLNYMMMKMIDLHENILQIITDYSAIKLNVHKDIHKCKIPKHAKWGNLTKANKVKEYNL